MTMERELVRTSCTMCNRTGNPASDKLYVRPGLFRDTDYDLGYGIPVCSGCGGLGQRVEDEDFQSRIKEIHRLRFSYCPIDELPALPAGRRYVLLRDLEARVTELYQLYGENRECFARAIAVDRVLKGRIEDHRQEMELILDAIQSSMPRNPVHDVFRPAVLALHRGGIEEGVRLYDEALEQHPNDSEWRFQYALAILLFFRDVERAVAALNRALECEPQRASHYLSAIMWPGLNKPEKRIDLPKAVALLDRAKRCPDSADSAEVLAQIEAYLAEQQAKYSKLN